ncbi:MAG: GHKL domain-containing protein [Desulfobacterales bacterium]|nr:GHKL domain-containing protein [Desulfobacterales bacterium]
MSKISFTVSARTARLIGQENFSTAEGAIVELVKNSYDADARKCIIIFSNHESYHNSLYIIDNGIGMTSEIIKNHWMKIGTDDKLRNFQSTRGRVKTGAKGIGRFALDRLGLSSKMFTISQKTKQGSVWSVKWSDFNKPGIAIHEVKADLDNADGLDIKVELSKKFSRFQRIMKLIEETEFYSGTILQIDALGDRWDKESLKSLFDNLEVLNPPQEHPDFDIHLFSTNTPDEFGQVQKAYYDDFDYKVSVKYLYNKTNSIHFEITRNELNVNELENSYSEIFDYERMKKFPFTLDTFKEKTFTFSKTIEEFSVFSQSVDKALINQIGEFEFTFYFLKNITDSKNRNKYPYKSFNFANRKAWLQKFAGVKIFRDGFRVRPYGENGQDWLGLGERQVQSPGSKLGGYRVGPNQISGIIKISRIANAIFQDKSGREGIQENEAFELFRNVLIEIISEFERDRNIIMFSLSELTKKRFKDEEEKRKAQEEADRILREQEAEKTGGAGTHENKSTETEKLLAKAAKIYEQELEDKNEEIRLLQVLASTGLIISSFAHELESLKLRLIPRTNFLITELKRYIKEENLKSINQEDNPFFMIELIKQEDIKLKHWLDYSLSTLKKDKRTRPVLNIDEYFQEFESTWKYALKQRGIKVILKKPKTSSDTVRVFEVDFDTIFNNLLSNSLVAFEERKGRYNRNVEIAWKRSGKFIEIVFTDNGCGLTADYKKNPDRIFDFNESSKRDRTGKKIGTGMGLYIVKLVINDYNGASIKLLPLSQGFSVGVRFQVWKGINND